MRPIVLFAALSFVVGCNNKDAETPPPKAESPEPSAEAPEPSAEAPATAAAPETPPPEPVNLTAEELKPTCAKIFPAELATRTHGATEVKEEGNPAGGMVICQMAKDGEPLGSATIACKSDLDPTAIERERAVMTKAQDLSPAIGRGGYRISSSFIFIDDETPCRVMVNWMTTPADDVWPDALRAIASAINPGTLK